MCERLRALWPLVGLPLLFVLLPAWLGGCASGDALLPPREVDLDRLFAPPTEAERRAVQEEWAARARGTAYEPDDVRVEFEETLPDGARFVLLSHTTGGAPHTHYGAVRLPPGEPPSAGWPVVLYNHGGAQGTDPYVQIRRFSTGVLREIGSRSVVVVPAFRSEPLLNTPLGALESGGAPSIWDRDVDDALALLNATLRLYSALMDEQRLVAIGGSRGGAVALLLALRDPRVNAVASYFGPTNFFGPSARSVAEDYLAGSSAEELGEELRVPKMVVFMLETVLQPLVEGRASYETARRELLRRSAAYFVDRLPHTIAHHHGCDATVPFEHFEALQRREAEFAEPPALYAYEPDCPGGVGKQFHTLSEDVMPGNGKRTAAFLEAHGNGPARPGPAD